MTRYDALEHFVSDLVIFELSLLLDVEGIVITVHSIIIPSVNKKGILLEYNVLVYLHQRGTFDERKKSPPDSSGQIRPIPHQQISVI